MGITYIKMPTENSVLGLWHITESAEELMAQAGLSETDMRILETKKTDLRKKEWLACRTMIRALKAGPSQIQYNPDGKPFFEDRSTNISISHSAEYACVYLNDDDAVGVDIQKVKPTIRAGADFFINQQEYYWIDKADNLMLHLIWSAKESAFKYACNSKLDLKKDILISPFVRNQNGVIEVSILNYNIQNPLRIRYELFGDYVLTMTI
jgi:4'-phosphopantetheinyl transferase